MEIVETSPEKRKVHVETWGCQMNVADSERMLALLEVNNYVLTKDVEAADLVLLNTCHIRESARHKVLSRLGVLNQLKEHRPHLKIAVTGCVAQADGKKLLALAPQIDVLLGPGKIDELPRLLREREEGGKPTYAIGFDRHDIDFERVPSPDEAIINLPTVTGKKEVTRFVNIIQGCNNFCTFCVVPFTRGREISRTKEDVLKEVTYMASQGAKEITLLGQNVNSYGLDLIGTEEVPLDGGPFVSLLREVSDIEGIERVRFTTSNPHDFSLPLANLFATHQKLGKHMHLPVQAGNDRTLERMKRKVTVEQYLERIAWLRQVVPDIAISTDLIVGFPGETEEEFLDTLKLVEKVRFSFIYAFKYSARKGTAAARFPDHHAEAVMEERLSKLNKLQDEITTEQNKAEIGQVRYVLFIYESLKERGIFIGRSQHFRTVRVRSTQNLVGQILPVKITRATKVAMEADLMTR